MKQILIKARQGKACDMSDMSDVNKACDIPKWNVTGSFVGSKGQRAGGNIPNDFALAEGKGWKLGCDREPSSPDAYCALVGSDTFSIGMTHAEYDDFVKVRGVAQRQPLALSGTGWARALILVARSIARPGCAMVSMCSRHLLMNAIRHGSSVGHCLYPPPA